MMESNQALVVAGMKNKLVAAIKGFEDRITCKTHDLSC
jgi:hypothetical protein